MDSSLESEQVKNKSLHEWGWFLTVSLKRDCTSI